jgi:hypothetical protein
MTENKEKIIIEKNTISLIENKDLIIINFNDKNSNSNTITEEFILDLIEV